jgi:hypothetical protein
MPTHRREWGGGVLLPYRTKLGPGSRGVRGPRASRVLLGKSDLPELFRLRGNSRPPVPAPFIEPGLPDFPRHLNR